ncbi:MAG: hypothetical protein PQJ46_15120 [Spirochaetales bacterium]|nr:hypothetical protein [Spirochaetales bacterium]
MKSFIIKSMEKIVYACAVIILLGFIIGGAVIGGFLGFVVGLLLGAIITVMFLGIFILFIEMADNIRAINKKLDEDEKPEIA